jgi:cytochrome oxidase Cu insertion factor (SCO1/SenC/PrrC family)
LASQEQGGPGGDERGLVTNNYALIFCFILIVVVIANSWHLSQIQSQSQIAQGADFTLPTISGDNFTVSSYRGKVIVLNFMQTSCQYCRAQMPQLKEVWDVYRGKIVMVSISVDQWGDSDNVLQAFANTYNASWIWARDVVGATIMYNVTGTPTTFVLDQGGQIRYRHEGYTDASTFLNDINELVNH